MATARPVRIPVPGARVRVADVTADLVNVSRTGILIRAPYALHPGTDWPLVLQVSKAVLQIAGRVVRCEATDTGAGSQGYTLALSFLSPSREVQRWLLQACGGAVEAHRGRTRRFKATALSRARHCPSCGSPRITKEARHRYYCNTCGARFIGLKLGPVRLAF
jgi:hypothetical protein